MDPSVIQHGVIITLVLTFKIGLWHCQEAEASFPIINLKIRNDSLHQRLLMEWGVSQKIYEPHMDVMFHIQVARSEKMNIIANEHFNPDVSSGRMTFTWSWDSQLPLECDSHSVRVRSAVPSAETNWSTWSPWKTHLGENKRRTHTVIYPHQRVVPEGSDVTFCCLPGQDQTVEEMKYNRNPVKRSLDMGTDSFVISLKNVTMTRSDGSNVICEVEKKRKSGTVLIVSRLPDEPKDFSCETQDLQTLRCRWIPGALYNFYGNLAVRYVLQERFSLKPFPCHRDYCDWTVQINQQMYNFTLTAKNLIGERSINSIVYLNQRVLLLAPSGLEANHVNATHITLAWSLRADYTSLQIQCQVDLQKDLVNMTSRGKLPIEIYSVSLSGLQPYTLYDLRVRCMAESSLAGWSGWSTLSVRTREDAPAGALDVWRHIEDDDDEERIVTLYWRPSPLFRANGNISHYKIKFWPLEDAAEQNEIWVPDVNSSLLSIGRRAYSISVTAHNSAGGSTPAELRIPANAASGTAEMMAERTYGKDGGISITWPQRSSVRGYVVEWCAAPRSPHCHLQWKKYNSTIQSDVIQSRDFRPGVRYKFRIYGSMKDGEHLLEKMEGYTEELVSSVKPDVEISNTEPRTILLDWSPYPTNESQEGFVLGYNVYVKDTERGCNLEKADEHVRIGDFYMCRFYIGDPNKMQMTINDLRPNGKYEVAVVAITGKGETPAEFKAAHTPPDTAAALLSIIVPIIVVSVLALMLLFIGCWKRTWLKKICFPDIPDPNKSKIFSFDIPKGGLIRNILPTTHREPQRVEIVRIQEPHQQKIPEEANVSPEYQLQEMYTKIQTSEGSIEDVDDCYLPEGSLSDPSHRSQTAPYLEFFNQTYTGTLDDTSDNVQGYRPQMNSAQVQCPPYAMQSVESVSGPDGDIVISFNSPDYGGEPKSPTSVGSTVFILLD